MRQTQETRLKEIEQKRLEMFHTAELTGMTSKETLRLSQELDKLLLAYQRSLLLSHYPSKSS